MQRITVFKTSDGAFYTAKEDALSHEKKVGQVRCIEHFVHSGRCPYPNAARQTLIEAILAWESYRLDHADELSTAFS